MTLRKLRKKLHEQANPKKALVLQRFFKTAPGEYGAGDLFLGITVPQQRKIAADFLGLSFANLQKLLRSKIHEERLIALLILVQNFNKTAPKNKFTGKINTHPDKLVRKNIFDFYLKNLRYVNNWDLVDSSAEHIVGGYLADKNHRLLFNLARSENLWERRIAMLATFYDIKRGQFNSALKIAQRLLNDQEDLIHKAVGWLLREIGKRHLPSEEKFLLRYYKKMPRTMLRYAIERFPEKRRLAYLRGVI